MTKHPFISYHIKVKAGTPLKDLPRPKDAMVHITYDYY